METISNSDTLIFHLDSMPSEQLTSNKKDDVLTIVGVFCNDENYIKKNYKQYKSGGLVNRIKLAEKLCLALKEEKIDLRVVSFMSHFHNVEALGKLLLEELIENDSNFKVHKNYYEFENKTISKNQALIVAWYSLALTKIARLAAQYCKDLNLKKFILGLDPLPHDEPDKGKTPSLDFLKYFMKNNKKIFNLWKDFTKEYGVNKCRFDYLGINKNVKNRIKKSKDEGGPILADWFAQSAHSATNIETFKNPEPNVKRDEVYRETIAGVIFELEAKKKWLRSGF